MHQVAGRSQAELCVFLVVAGVGEIVRVAEFDKARIFDASVFLVVGLRNKHGFGVTAEVDAICALGIAETGYTAFVLSPIEHNELAMMDDHGGIEGSSRFPAIPLRREHRVV